MKLLFPGPSPKILARFTFSMLLAANIMSLGCSKSQEAKLAAKFVDTPPNGTTGEAPPLQTSKDALIGFRKDDVTSLSIFKDDPRTGDRWVARFQRKNHISKDPSRPSDPPQWFIEAGPGSENFTDRLAYHELINHLLSSLSEVKIVEKALKSDPAAIGLKPPRWALRFKTRFQEFEVRFGATEASSGATYAQRSNSFEADTATYMVKGSIFGLFEHVKTFSHLRHRRIATFTENDVAKLEIHEKKAKPFKAERLSGKWADQRKKPIEIVDMNDWLKRLVHLQASRIVDDPAESKRLYESSHKNPAIKFISQDRRGNETFIHVLVDPKHKRPIVTTSSRPDAAFEIEPVGMRFFRNPIPAKNPISSKK